MNKYPCSDRCPTFAMCEQRHNFEKFKVCTEYANYIVEHIEKTQSSFDEEFGKGRRTVVCVTGGDDHYMIDKKGDVVTTVKTVKEITCLESDGN